MNSDRSQLRQQQQESLEHTQKTSAVTEGRTFENVEEMLRYDSAQNPVPPDVAEKLNNSLAAEPKSSSSWWMKLFKP